MGADDGVIRLNSKMGATFGKKINRFFKGSNYCTLLQVPFSTSKSAKQTAHCKLWLDFLTYWYWCKDIDACYVRVLVVGGTVCTCVFLRPEWPSAMQRCASCTDGCGFKPWPGPPSMLVDMDQKGSAAILTSFLSAGVTSEVNLRTTQAKWLWTPSQMSPEVQKRPIGGPMKRTYVPPQKNKQKFKS